MKKIIVIIIGVFLNLNVYAQEQEPTANRDEDRTQLRKILADIQEQLNKQDMNALLSHFDEKAIVSFMTTEVAVGRQGILDYYNKMFKAANAPLADYHTEATLDGHATFHGDTITASGRTQDRYTLVKGGVYNFNTRWVATAVKKEGKWLVVALDFSVSPFDNVVLSEAVSKIYRYALLAFVLGVVLTFVLFKLVRVNGDKRSKTA